MENLDEKLNSLLNDPAAMRTIMDLAQQLSGGEKQPDESPPPKEASGFDPDILGKLLPILQEFRSGSSDSLKLLYAIQPYLSERKSNKVEKAAKLAHLIHIGKKLLAEGGWELV